MKVGANLFQEEVLIVKLFGFCLRCYKSNGIEGNGIGLS